MNLVRGRYFGILEPLTGNPHINSNQAKEGTLHFRRVRTPQGSDKVAEKGFATMSRVPSLSSPFLLGFDEIERVLDRVSKAADGYPPYNIERVGHGEKNPECLRITLAVAGFTRDQLDVTVEENQLVIPARQFQRTFVLVEGMEVLGADLKNGLLSIDLVRPEPERLARSIAINEEE